VETDRREILAVENASALMGRSMHAPTPVDACMRSTYATVPRHSWNAINESFYYFYKLLTHSFKFDAYLNTVLELRIPGASQGQKLASEENKREQI